MFKVVKLAPFGYVDRKITKDCVICKKSLDERCDRCKEEYKFPCAVCMKGLGGKSVHKHCNERN